MRTKNCFSLIEMLIVLAVLALLAAISIPKLHADPFQPNYWVTDTNTAATLTVTNAQGKTFTGKKFILRQGRGLSEFVTVVSTNSTAASITIGHDVTWDGTNGTTTGQYKWTVPGNFVGTNTFHTNWPSTVLNNVRTFQATTLTNNTAGAFPGSNSLTATITYSQDNQP